MKEHSPTYSMKPTLPWYQNPEYDTTEENKTTDYLSHTTKRKKSLTKYYQMKSINIELR